MKRSLWFILLMGMAICSTGLTQGYDVHGLRFVVQPGINSILDCGYLYLRVNVTNTTARERSVRLYFDSVYGYELESVSKTFKIAANESRQEALILPTIEFSSRGLEVEVDGQSSKTRLTANIRTSHPDNGSISALADNNFTKQELEDIFGTGKPLKYMNLNLKQFEGSSSQLFKDWLGYTQYKLLFFYGKTLTSLEPEIRDAVFDYIRMGGKLVCLGNPFLPDDFKPVEASAGALSKMQVFAGGFGQVYVTDKTEIAQLDSDDLSAIGSLRPRLEGFPATHAHSPITFESHNFETLSTVILVLVTYLFAFLIGPANFYWLNKYSSKIYIFWTVPALSAIFCGLFFLYYSVIERPIFKANQISLTYLDQENTRALTRVELGVYSAMNRPKGIHFPVTAEVLPHRNAQEFPKVINLDHDQHFSDGWLRPKVPRYFSVKQLESRREQVQLSKNGEGYNLLNGLGADIIEITVCDHSSRLWHAKNISAGASNQLVAVPQSKTGNITAHRQISLVNLHESRWYKSIGDFNSFPERFLGPGMYLAKLRHCPFFPDRFDGRAELNADSYVIGLLKRKS